MTKREIIKILCQSFGYPKETLEAKTYAEVKKILADEKREQRESSADDEADLFPNGRDRAAEDEEYL